MCTRPMIAQKHLRPDGKYKVVFCGARFIAGRDQLETIAPLVDPISGLLEKPYVVPCGSCFECKTAFSRRWSTRIVCESLTAKPDQSWFLTLTYADECLPPMIEDNGVPIHNLEPRDVTLFIKRLRKRFGEGIRYFYCGEYGGSTGRPHYHMCIFNLDIQDLQYYNQNFEGDLLYISPELESIWDNGFVVVGALDAKTASYTSRYSMKKLKDEALFYSTTGLQKPFARMSRKPGLGYDYFCQNVDAETRKLYLPAVNGKSNIQTIPRYFKEKQRDMIVDSRDIQSLDKFDSYWDKVAETLKLDEVDRKVSSGLSERDYLTLKERLNDDRQRVLMRSL